MCYLEIIHYEKQQNNIGFRIKVYWRDGFPSILVGEKLNPIVKEHLI